MGTKKDFIKKAVRSPDFWVRVDAIGTGVSVATESVLLGIGACLPAVPFVLGVIGVGAAIALGSCALYSLYVGATGTWDFLKETHHDTFHADKPKAQKSEKPESTIIDRLAHHRFIYPIAKKIADTKPGRAFVNSKLGQKMRYGLTQKQRDIFMVSLNTKGSLFTGGAAVTYIVMHTLALPVLTLGAMLTAPIAVATLWACKSTFDITCSMTVLFKHLRQKRADKKAAKHGKEQTPVVAPVTVPAPVPQPAPAAPLPVVTPAFETAAAAAADKKPDAVSHAPKMPVAPPPAPPGM